MPLNLRYLPKSKEDVRRSVLIMHLHSHQNTCYSAAAGISQRKWAALLSISDDGARPRIIENAHVNG